ncbi:MAG: hypothetical protein VKN33_08670 [Candidatus Sericytochromatia bacterium]|nr:hypothetical protein [Candidatus Sericytochromatia bacterium]
MMTRSRNKKLLPLVFLALQGCAQEVVAVSPGEVIAHGTISLVRVPRDYRLQTLRSANDEIALNAGEIRVYLADQLNPAPGRLLTTLPGTSRSLSIQRLRQNETYRVLLQAYKPDPNDPSALVPMSDDEHSVVSFDTLPTQGAYQTTQEVTFKLRLRDQIFSGTADGNLSLSNGEIVNTFRSEVLKPTTLGFTAQGGPL